MIKLEETDDAIMAQSIAEVEMKVDIRKITKSNVIFFGRSAFKTKIFISTPA